MIRRQRGGKLAALACAMALFVLGSMGSRADAAPRATDLGPEAPMAEPSGGFVGQLKVTPAHGPVGTPVTVTGQGFPAEQEFQVVWRTVKFRCGARGDGTNGRAAPSDGRGGGWPP